MKRKLFIGLLIVIIAAFLTPTQGYSWGGKWKGWKNLSTIVSPNWFEELDSYPVEILIQFNQGARPETFKAWLNRRNITDRFEEIENGVRALVGPEDGLIILVKGKPRCGPKMNILRTEVKGAKRKKDIDFRVFSVEIEALESLATFFGPEVFVRGRGRPVTETREFSTGGFQAPFILHLCNGDEEGKNRVSRARVWLNGQLLFRPSDFSRRVSGYDIVVALTEPSILKVRIAGKPGSKLTIWIEGRPFGPPLNMILDDGSSVSAIVSPEEGGSLETVTADGIRYVLEIPEDALSGTDDVLITMTPIIGILEELPPSLSLLGAVRLEPDGLRFLRPVTLTIDLPPGTLLDEAIGFSYYSLYEEFHFYPIYSIDTTESSLVFQLMHFSDNGVLSGQISNCDGHGNPSSPEDIAKQKIQCILLEAGLRQMTGASEQLTEDDLNQIHDILLEWFDNSVLPGLNAAIDFYSLEEATKQLYSWYETAQEFFDSVLVYFTGQLMSAEGAINSTIEGAVGELNNNCLEETDPCLKKDIIKDAFDWIGFAQLLETKYALEGIDIIAPDLEQFCGGVLYSQVDEIDIIQESIELNMGEEFTLEVEAKSIVGQIISDPSLEWTSTDPNIASVNNGVVKGEGEGTTEIFTGGGCDAQDSITVTVIALELEPVGSIEIVNPPPDLSENDATQLEVEVKDSDGNVLTGRDVTWTSSDPNKVMVNETTGYVIALREGCAWITATCEGISVKIFICVVYTPTPGEADYRITWSYYGTTECEWDSISSSWTTHETRKREILWEGSGDVDIDVVGDERVTDFSMSGYLHHYDQYDVTMNCSGGTSTFYTYSWDYTWTLIRPEEAKSKLFIDVREGQGGHYPHGTLYIADPFDHGLQASGLPASYVGDYQSSGMACWGDVSDTKTISGEALFGGVNPPGHIEADDELGWSFSKTRQLHGYCDPSNSIPTVYTWEVKVVKLNTPEIR